MKILMITVQSKREKNVFDDMIVDIMTSKKFQALIKELLLGAEN